MKNYYFVTSLNMSNPRVKTMIDKLSIGSIVGSMIDVKLRSKLFMSFSDVSVGVASDVDTKIATSYPDEKDPNCFVFSVPNPDFATHPNDAMAVLLSKLNNASNNWDANCCKVTFVCDNPEIDEDGAAELTPNSWLFKYEIFYTEDAIELSGNGDFMFSKANVARNAFTSTYH